VGRGIEKPNLRPFAANFMMNNRQEMGVRIAMKVSLFLDYKAKKQWVY